MFSTLKNFFLRLTYPSHAQTITSSIFTLEVRTKAAPAEISMVIAAVDGIAKNGNKHLSTGPQCLDNLRIS